MRCPQCGFDNPPGFDFCGKCRAALSSVADPPGLMAHDLNRLRRYLPAPLVEDLQLDAYTPPVALLNQAQTHLIDLLVTAASHLPSYLVERVLRDPTPGRVGGQFVQGTLLFADISGFTAMSEKLSRIGREGAEEITGIVNRYFDVMLEQLREYNGQLIKFGGDALLALFAEPPHDSATRAAQAALHMQAAMSAFKTTSTSQGLFELKMKVGLRYGRFFAAELGTPQAMEYALFGADVNAAAAAESAAEAGQVLADSATLAAFSMSAQTAPGPDGYAHIISFDSARPSTPGFSAIELIDRHLGQRSGLEQIRHLVELLDALSAYLPAGLLARIGRVTKELRLEGEHRLVSILFGNIVGLGEIADRLGPGREKQIVAALNQYFVPTQEAVRRFGGVVNKIDLYTHGDKLLAFFGAPAAHEDDAERAVRTAWKMQADLAQINRQVRETLSGEGLAGDHLALRQKIGLSYGYAFAGYMGTPWRREYTVMGDEVNLAARLMSAAEADSITVTSSVFRKARSLFELAPRGQVTLRGKSKPFRIFTVTAPRAIPEPVRGLAEIRSPLVGRDTEWRQLLMTEQLLTGRGQIVSVIGEAGLGKSRLVAELQQHLQTVAKGRLRWVEGRSFSYTETVSYWPFQEVVRRLIGMGNGDSDRVALAKLRETLATHLAPDELQTTLPFLAAFLELPLEDEVGDSARHLDAEATQRRTFLAVRRLIEVHALSASPLVLMLDDLHWMDPASLMLLEFLMPLVIRLPVMLLLVYRGERAKGCWAIREKATREFPHCTTEVTLQNLKPEDGLKLLTNLLPEEQWPPALRERLLGRAEGNPLYIEEMLRILIDRNVLVKDEAGRWNLIGDWQSVNIPDTLQGVLMTRLDALDEYPHHVAQVAAVVGRSFSYDVLASMEPGGNSDLIQHLARLQQHEIIREAQRVPELVYSFGHVLMQEVCYESLLARVRRDYHRKIAEHLESNLSDSDADSASRIPLIAHHAFAGQDWPRALKYQLLAGSMAQDLFANQAAIEHFTKALESATILDATDTQEQSLAIHLALGELLTTTGAYEQAQAHLLNAREMAVARGDIRSQALACRWLARRCELGGDYPQAFEWIQRTLDTVGGSDAVEAAQALLISGLIHLRQGDLDHALQHCQQALRIAQAVGAVTAEARGLHLLGLITRNQGATPESIDLLRRAETLYREVGHLQGQGLALNELGNSLFTVGDWESAERYYRQAREMFDQIGDLYDRAFADNNLGELALNQGRLDDALAFYQSALSAQEELGQSAYVVGVLHMNIGAIYLWRGEPGPAREHLTISAARFEQTQARDFLPELHRYFAKAALLVDDSAEAERQARQALALAREMALPGEEGSALRVVGEVASYQQRYAEAETPLAESVALLQKVGDELELARSLCALARVHWAQGQREAALAGLERGQRMFEQLKATMDLLAVQRVRAEMIQDNPR